jgi:aspartate carbamoyltransferase catalytic subunit
MTPAAAEPILKSSHLLGTETLSVSEVASLLDLADSYVALSRSANKKTDVLKGRTLINLFFEASTRTQSSFELAGKRLGADVLNMSVKTSSVSKGETLIDTATTLNAMRPDSSRASSTAASSMPVTAATNIRRRRCLTR